VPSRQKSPDADPTKTAVRLLDRIVAALPGGGEERPGQSEMAATVAKAIRTGAHLVIQAGTGTGKSLAYLVPAALSGKVVVVATATKALQDQLATKDLPLVSSAIDTPFSWAVLKGRSNYLCRQRAEEMADGGEQQSLTETDEGGDADAVEDPGPLADQVRRILRWAGRTMSGDRADLPFEPSSRAWSMVSVGPRECPGAFRCPSGNRCFAEAARDTAAAADIVVVNTHLYGAHLAAGGGVLPPHEVVIFDEAHELEEVMTASLGVELTPGRFRALGVASRAFLGTDDRPVADAVGEVADRMQSVLTAHVGTRGSLGAESSWSWGAAGSTRCWAGSAGPSATGSGATRGRCRGRSARRATWPTTWRGFRSPPIPRWPGLTPTAGPRCSASPPSTWARHWPVRCGARSPPS
jgi:ATP-dependent DNA helicase DinG